MPADERTLDVRALTLWRPWDYAITDLGKRVENRPKPPPAALLGKRVALHAGLTYKLDGFAWPDGVERPNMRDPETARKLNIRAGKLVAVATIVGWRDTRFGNGRVEVARWATGAQGARIAGLGLDPWWLGPVGILLEDVFPLREPVPCRGQMGWWELPEESLVGDEWVRVSDRVLAQVVSYDSQRPFR